MRLLCIIVLLPVLAVAAQGQFRQSPGVSLENAARGSSVNKGSTGEGLVARRAPLPVELLTPTEGVDFSPYIGTVMRIVRRNWFAAAPDSVRTAGNPNRWHKPKLKRGVVKVGFAIARDGAVTDLHVVESSGDDELDAAAMEGISSASPLPALPEQFKHERLEMRMTLHYNPAHPVAGTGN